MMSFTGREVQKLVKIGSLIVSTEENSVLMEKTYRAHPLIAGVYSCLHWIRGAFAIFNTDDDDVKAVNVTRYITSNISELPEKKRNDFQLCTLNQGYSCVYLNFHHFIGGPCPQETGPVGLVRIPRQHVGEFQFSDEIKVISSNEQDDSDVYAGPFRYMVSELERVSMQLQKNFFVHIFWGEAIWTRTQFLGEIARGDWGLCGMNCNDAFPPGNAFNAVWHQLWRDQRPIVTPSNEMKDYHDRERKRQEEDIDRELRRRARVLQRAEAAAREYARDMSEDEEEESSGSSMIPIEVELHVPINPDDFESNI